MGILDETVETKEDSQPKNLCRRNVGIIAAEIFQPSLRRDKWFSKGLRRKEGSRRPYVYVRRSYINHVVGVGQCGLSSEG